MTLTAALKRDDANELIEGFFAVERELRAMLDERMAPFGISFSQFTLLRFIQAPRDTVGAPTDHATRAKDIADHFGFAPRTVTVAIDRLVAKGLVVRHGSRLDRRSFDLVVTSKGQKAFEGANGEFLKACAALSNHMPSTHRNALWHAIPRLLEYINGRRKKARLKKRQPMAS